MPGVLHDVTGPNVTRELPTEEAIALALAMCQPGQSILVHAADCPVTVENPDACTCEPDVYRRDAVGAA